MPRGKTNPRDARQIFMAALDTLVAQIRPDTSILAAILCGSLAHDTVWDKSDVDLVLITIDEVKVSAEGMSLYADGVNVHASLMTRSAFRRLVQGAMQNSFMHSLLAKGRLLYTHDETIARLCESLHELGARDREVQLLRAATGALPPLYKAHKWLITRGDLDYTALWLLYVAMSIARIEVISSGAIAGREVVPEAQKLNPALLKTIYGDLLHEPVTRARIDAALKTVDDYLSSRATILFAPVLNYLREAGEARACSEIEHYFSRNFEVVEVTTVCEYLADQKLIGKVSIAAKLTKRSPVSVEELAFVYLDPASDPVDEGNWEPEGSALRQRERARRREPRTRSEPAKRRTSGRVGESEGRSPSGHK